MSIVYILGAGASHGEALTAADRRHPHSIVPPPMTTGFFSKDLLDALNQDVNMVREEFDHLLRWIWRNCLTTHTRNFGEGEWKSLNIEDVFTRLEISREFESPVGLKGASLLVIRNELLSYIRRIIGSCTRNSQGAHSRSLFCGLRPDDSLFTFNWDLLLDDCFLGQPAALPQYYNFLDRMGALDEGDFVFRQNQGDGLFLKLHGSLNWFQCTNPICAVSGRVIFRSDTNSCLAWSLGRESYRCRRCGSDSVPLIIPPVLRKPITEQETVRAVWGLARTVSESADVIVIIGFSAAPTDFYASWLLRETVIDPTGIKEALSRNKTIIIVNPLNDSSRSEHEDFKARMLKLFPSGYNSDFTRFDQVEQVCGYAKANDKSIKKERNPPTNVAG